MLQIYTKKAANAWLSIACVEKQIFTASFADTESTVLHKILENLPYNLPFQVFLTPTGFVESTFTLMDNILEGKDTNLNVNLMTQRMPQYTKRVLKAVMKIPVGYVASYGSVAKVTKGGPRAVGNIMAGNIFAPIIPCHRVVKSDFSLGGYASGLKVKHQLLTKEKRGFTKPIDIKLGEGSMQVFPVEYALKESLFL